MAVVFRLIGVSSGASKASICIMLFNLPVMAVTAVNGWIGDHYGVPAILIVEAVLTILSLAVFAVLFPAALRRRAGAMAAVPFPVSG